MDDLVHQIRIPKPNLSIEAQDVDVLFSMLIFGEARGESMEVKKGVGHVAFNRSKHPRWWGRNLLEVILRPYQFSCFLSSDPNRNKLLLPLKYESAETWDECFLTACGILSGELPDNTENSDHYFDDSIPAPRWAVEDKFVKTMGRLSFYRLELEAPG